MSYMTQFTVNEERVLIVPEFLLRLPWEDVSWGNDAMPRFESTSHMLAVWVDYDNVEDREYEDGNKFTVVRLLGTTDERELGEETLLATDDDVALERFLAGFEPDELTTEDLAFINETCFSVALVEAGKLLVNALDSAPTDEAKERVQAAIDEINTLLHS